MAEGLVKSVFHAVAVATDSAILDSVTKTWNGFVVQTAGFSGTLNIMGRMQNTGWMNALYAVREEGDDLYGDASDDALTYTTDTSQYYIALAEPFAQLQVIMTRSAGSITMDVLEGAPSPMAFQVIPVAVASVTVGAVTIADGADVAEGAKADTAVTNPASSATEIALLKGILTVEENAVATLLASAARTATTSSPDQTNLSWRGAHIIIKATAKSASPSVVPTVEGKDPLTGDYYTILTAAAITDTGTVVLKVYPGVTVAANLAVSDVLPKTWRVTMTADDADSLTYSIAANLIR